MATSTRTRPARRARPALPPGLRLSLAERIDGRLAAIVGGSVVVHGVIALAAWLGDAPEPMVHTPFVPVTYQQDVIDISIPDVEAPLPTPSEPGAAMTPATPTQTPRPIVTPSRVQPSPPRSAQAPVDSQQLASILTGANGETGHTGSMSSRQPSFDLGSQIANARNEQIGDGTRTAPRTVETRIGTTDRAPLVDDPTLTRSPPKHADEPTARIIPGTVKPETRTTLTAAIVLERVNAYMAGLQRCYKLGLAEDSTLSGRVEITFIVDERGHVIEPDASGVSAGVETCIENRMKAWRMPMPKDNDGAATDASFALTLALQPSN